MHWFIQNEVDYDLKGFQQGVNYAAGSDTKSWLARRQLWFSPGSESGLDVPRGRRIRLQRLEWYSRPQDAPTHLALE